MLPSQARSQAFDFSLIPRPIFLAYMLTITKRQKNRRLDGWTDVREKIGLVSTAGVVVRMRLPLPRIWVTEYLSKICCYIYLLYTSTFNCVSWLLDICMMFCEAIVYAQSCIRCEELQLKPKREEALAHLFNGKDV